LRADADIVRLAIGEGLNAPKGGLVLPWPFEGAPGATTIDGQPAEWRDGELRVMKTPAIVEIERR
jgi:hypothetical protein